MEILVIGGLFYSYLILQTPILHSLKLQINIINSNKAMSGLNAINYILDNIVKGGKAILKDRSIDKQKVPPFVSTRVRSINLQSVIHEGNQHQPVRKFGLFSLQKDKQPKNIKKDGLGPNRLNIDKQKVVKPKAKSPENPKHKHRSFSHGGLKGEELKSEGFKTSRVEERTMEKQNHFVKLEEDNKNRIVIERVKMRESMEDDQLRAQKQKQMLKQYEEKMANEIFQKERVQKQIVKQKVLKEHRKRGEDHKFYFNDEGEAILFKNTKSSLASYYLQPATFKLDDQEANIQDEEAVNTKKPYLSKKHFQSAKNMNQFKVPIQHNENQRIRSAKGQAFASSVLKTVNLSRISMNQSLTDLQVEQFMKRNDLFNNNHTRQTTSIPYLQTKPGTVYTQLSTNQIVTNQPSEKYSESKKSSNENSRVHIRRKSHFQPLSNQGNPMYKTQRKFDKMQRNNEDDDKKVEARSIKTAEQYSRRVVSSERRPQTSGNKGKITTVNEQLAMVLIQ